MAIKHKVLKDFQLLTTDKKIITLKSKTVLEDYKYITKNDNVVVEKDVINNNPDYFSIIDWKEELNTYLKQNKIPQPTIITKKLIPFLEEMFVINASSETKEIIKEVIKEVPVEIIKEVNVDRDFTSKELELNSKIKKNELLEQHLKSEIENLNSKSFELDQKEKQLTEQEVILNRRHSSLESIEKNLNEKETKLNKLESDFSSLIDKSEAISKISDSLMNLQNSGYQIRHYSGHDLKFIDILSKINI
jgi:predicted RNase H-like nuclease (RuvC/YqgF family)